VKIKQIGDLIVGLKLACETDFVAKNDTFHDLASQILDLVAGYGAVENYESLDQEKKDELNKVLQDNFVTIGENMQIADVFTSSDKGYIYTHPGDKVAAVVYYEGDEEKAKQTALQIAAMNPTHLCVGDVDQSEKDTMKAAFEEEMKDSGKPAEILENIITGKMNKKYSEFVLLEQVSIFDDSKKVKDLLGETKVNGYVRYAI
jgi:elongation factor Ts